MNGRDFPHSHHLYYRISEMTVTWCETNSAYSYYFVMNLKYDSYTYILIIKANEMHYFSNLFDKVLYMFQTGPLPIIRSIPTLYALNRHLSR